MFEELPCRNFCYSATCHNNVKLEPTTYGSDRYYYSFPSPDGTYFGKLFFQHHLIPIGQLNLKISHIILTLGYAIITKGSKWIWDGQWIFNYLNKNHLFLLKKNIVSVYTNKEQRIVYLYYMYIFILIKTLL